MVLIIFFNRQHLRSTLVET